MKCVGELTNEFIYYYDEIILEDHEFLYEISCQIYLEIFIGSLIDQWRANINNFS